MRTHCLVVTIVLGIVAVASSSLFAEGVETNLLKNPGFEDSENWLSHWKVENTRNDGPPYVYPIGLHGNGGHLVALPYRGEHAIEIYSAGRVTRLSQTVPLTAGKYRVTAQACIQGGGDSHQLLISLGEQTRSLPVVAMDYRLYFADFSVTNAGEHRVSFVSSQLGMALDELTLTKFADDETHSPPPPHLLFDLVPSSPQRSRGIQTCLEGQPQWIDFSISCIAPERLGNPRLRLTAPQRVKVLGFNTEFLKAYRAPQTTDASVRVAEVLRDGELSNEYSFAVPRFAWGVDKPLQVGGFWVEVPPGDVSKLIVELEDNGRVFPAREITLVPVSEPWRHATPRKFLTVAYSVQNWRQSPPQRLAALPRQFAMMGFNVWSDYGLTATSAVSDPLTADEQVRSKAFREFGVTEFWPNSSNMFQTDGGGQYPNLAGKVADADEHAVKGDGTTDKAHYNMRFVARNGVAWRDSVLAAYQTTLTRPAQSKLPFTNNGLINDGLEGLLFSYDKTTLADFANTAKIDPQDATVENLNGKFKPQWLSYNMALYNQIVRHWAEALRQIDPQAKTVNTLGTFGPIGARESLPVPEQMPWAKAVDYTMPQWYGSMGFYGSHFHDQLMSGVAQKVYGKQNGYADVIPLLNVSMSVGLEDPRTLRFKLFDLVSASSVVRGIGYYIATHAFADGRFMAELSRAHTLLAETEDYYADGKRSAEFAAFVAADAESPTVEALGLDGKPTRIKMDIRTSARTHVLDRSGRIALFTVITHCNGPIGQSGTLKLSPSFLEKHASDPSRLVMIDWLRHRILPFAPELPVDTTQTANMALFEIAEKDWAEKNVWPNP